MVRKYAFIEISGIFVSLFLICTKSLAQENQSAGWLPRISLTWSAGNSYRITGMAESRLQTYRKGAEPAWNSEYLLTDYILMVSRKAGARSNTNAGYTLRVSELFPVHRFIQQFTFITGHEGFRLGHRVQTDQTIGEGRIPEFRLRYRIGAERALEGEIIDEMEWYLRYSAEIFGIHRRPDFDIETRAVGVLGYGFSSKNRLEFGGDYRLRGFINRQSSSQFWLALSWFLSLN
jgi:hypothetical protein